jgi:hypothetical protein
LGNAISLSAIQKHDVNDELYCSFSQSGVTFQETAGKSTRSTHYFCKQEFIAGKYYAVGVIIVTILTLCVLGQFTAAIAAKVIKNR